MQKKRTKQPPVKASPRAGQIQRGSLDSHQRVQSILYTAEVATWTWDIEADRVVADENFARLFGVSVQDAGGAPIAKYLAAIHPDDLPTVTAAIAKAVEGPDDRYEVEYRVCRPDGSMSWISARGKVTRTAGKPRYFPGVAIDITSRKASEQKMAELRHRLEQQLVLFDATLSSITDFAYIFDRRGRFVYTNQALLNLWGLRLEDAVGKNFFELQYPEELARRLQSQIQQVFESKQGLTDETPYQSPTGAGGYYEYIFTPVFDRDGHVEMVAGSTRDITARKKTEQDLKKSQEQLAQAAETLEAQVHARTLELNQRNSEILAQSDQLRNLSLHLMETQDREGRRLARELHDSAGQLIAALTMNLDRLVSSLRTSDPGLVKLAQDSRDCAKQLAEEIRTTSYLLHPPLLDEVGLSAALDWYVEGIKQRSGLAVDLKVDSGSQRLPRDMELTIFRVVQECLTNIHRHSGSKTAFIHVARNDQSTIVEVRDAGRGMSGDLQNGESRGMGVGLRGIRERVRQFAGDVHVESKVGVGTTIRVTLPLTRN
jgi:PAS domain S-box-containing protein